MVLKTCKRVISMILAISLIITSCFIDEKKCFAGGNEFIEQTVDDGVYEICDFGIDRLGSGFIRTISRETDQVEAKSGMKCVPDQKFYVCFDKESRGYKIRSLYTGKYLGVRKVDDVTSQRISQNELSKDFYQDWIIQKEYGEYSLRLKTEPGQFKYLTVEGKKFIYPTDKENIAKAFSLYKSDFSGGMCEITSPALLGDITYSVLDTNTVDKTTGIGLKPGKRNGYASQKFFIEYHVETDDYTILSMYPKMFLGVNKNAESQSSVVCHREVDDTDKCRWLISNTDDGFFRIKSKYTGESLEISDAGLTLTSKSDAIGQKFELSNIQNSRESGWVSSALSPENVITLENKNEKSGVILSKRQKKPNDQQSFAFNFNKTDGSNVFCDFNDGYLAADANGKQILRYPKSENSDSKWLFLKFKSEKEDFFKVILMSSVSTENKENKFLSMTASEDQPKDGSKITLTDREINDKLDSQAFIFKGSIDFLLYALDQRLLEKKRAEGDLDAVYARECIQEESGPKLSATDLKELGITEGRTTAELMKLYPEYLAYESYINDVVSNTTNPELTLEESILTDSKTDLETISKKLSYICNRIYLSGKEPRMKPYPVQVLAVLKLVNSILNPKLGKKGSIGELKTGEGKSFVVTLAAILLKSYGRKVDIATPNMALASRDWREQKEYYNLFGITSGFLYNKVAEVGFADEQNENSQAKQFANSDYNLEILEKDIVYSTSGNFEWVYLENMSRNQQRAREYDVCIVDEVDNILVDGASGSAMFASEVSINKEKDILRCVYTRVTEAEHKGQCISAEALIKELETSFDSDKKLKFDQERIKLLIKAAQEANTYENGKDYVKKGGQIYCIDQNTGFILHATRIRDYIHEMIEIKEKVKGQNSTFSSCAVSPAIFYNGYKNLIGVTGTAGAKRELEIYNELYHLEVFKIPENREIKRQVNLNVIESGECSEDLVAKEAREVASTGRPVLIILDSIKDTDKMSRKYFPEANLIQGVYAKADRKSIAEAGKPGKITISTIAAGRGTNIVLTKDALKAGGLHVIVAKLPPQSRTLMQNVGRAARQGQPGSATVYVNGKEKFGKLGRFDLNTVNLFKLQEKFYRYIDENWKNLLIPQDYRSDAEYNYGDTIDDILRSNVETIAEKYYWPKKKLNDQEAKELYNIMLSMILMAWSKMYTDLSMDPKSVKWEHCEQKYKELISNIDYWLTKNADDKYKSPEEYIEEFAKRVERDKKTFDLLYSWQIEKQSIEEYICEILSYRRVQVHMLNENIDITKPYITDREIEFLPIEHQQAYKKYKEAQKSGTATKRTGEEYFKQVNIEDQIHKRWSTPIRNSHLDPNKKDNWYEQNKTAGVPRKDMEGLDKIEESIRKLSKCETEEVASLKDTIESVSISVPVELREYEGKNWTFQSIKFDKNSPQKENQEIKIIANVEGSIDSLEYKFTYAKLNKEGVSDWSKQGETWDVISGYKFQNEINWCPIAGKYRIYVDIKDIKGKVRTRSAEYEIIPIYTFKGIIIDEKKQKLGSKFHISADVRGAVEDLQYKYEYMKYGSDADKDPKRCILKDYSKSSSVDWTPKEAGKYIVYISVKSPMNRVDEKSIQLEVVEIPKRTIEDGLYLISPSRNKEKYVQIERGQTIDKKAKIQIDGDSNNTKQIFYLAYDPEDGYYSIIQWGSGKCLGVEDIEAGQGTPICQYRANLRDNFKWKIISVGDGTYQLELKSNGMRFDLSGGSTENGTPLQIWLPNTTPAQKFRIKSFDVFAQEIIAPIKEEKSKALKAMSTLPEQSKAEAQKFIDVLNQNETETIESIKVINQRKSDILELIKTMHRYAVEEKVSFDETLTNITREDVFCCSNAKVILLPTTVTSVEPKAFWDNPKIDSVIADPKWLPCFRKENIKNLKIPEGVKKVSRSDIEGCKNLKCVLLPLSEIEIEKGAFAGCSPDLRIETDTSSLQKNLDNVEDAMVEIQRKLQKLNPIEKLLKERDKLVNMYKQLQSEVERLDREYVNFKKILNITEDHIISLIKIAPLKVDMSAERSSTEEGLKAQIDEISEQCQILVKICDWKQQLINDLQAQWDELQIKEKTYFFENKGIILPDASMMVAGKELQLIADVRGNTEGLLYDFICQKDGDPEAVYLNEYTTSAVCTWVPQEAGKYVLTLIVSNDEGEKKVANVSCEIKVAPTTNPLPMSTPKKEQPIPAQPVVAPIKPPQPEPTRSEVPMVQTKPTTSTTSYAQPDDQKTTIDDLVELDGGNARYAVYAKNILRNIETGSEQGDGGNDPGLGGIAAKVNNVCVKMRNQHGIKAHPVQVLTALRLVDNIINGSGSIAQVKTGEGKSIIIAIVAIVLVQYGHKVDVVTSTTDLAKRDQKNQAKYYDMYGIGSGVLYSKDSDRGYEPGEEEKEGYSVGALRKPILYSTNSNLQFLHLHSIFRNTSLREEDYVRAYDVVIVDEVDNMLIDQATSPAIIGNNIEVKDADDIIKDVYSMRNIKAKGILKLIQWKYKKSSENITLEIIEMMQEAALIAEQYVKDQHYVIVDGTVEIYDHSTGHSKPGSRWRNYIHEMVEVKEGLPIRPPSYSFCTISQKAFFKLYKKIAGVTGTVGDKRDESLLKSTYNVNIFRMARNLQSKQEILYRDRGKDVESAFGDINAQITAMTNAGRPVLVIFSSKRLVDDFCAKYRPSSRKILGIDPNADEAAIGCAGAAGAVTIATNAAGRGMDIKISKAVEAAGGLHVIIAEWPSSARVLEQAMGRSARQGQKGSVCIYRSPNDVYIETPDFDEKYEYLTELQGRFAAHIREKWPWMYKNSDKSQLAAQILFGADVNDVIKAMMIPFISTVGVQSLVPVIDALDIPEGIVYNMVMLAWGSFFTDASEHIEEYASKDDLEQDYQDFLKDLYNWIPENIEEEQDVMNHLIMEGTIAYADYISGMIMGALDEVYNKIPGPVQDLLNSIYVPQILKIAGGIAQIVVGIQMIRSKEGAMQGVVIILLGLNAFISGVTEIVMGSVFDPLKEATGHKLDNTIDLISFFSEAHAIDKIVGRLKAIKASEPPAKAGETYESARAKLQEEMKKLKGAKKLTDAENRLIDRLARKEARHARAKNAPGKKYKIKAPEKPIPEKSTISKVKRAMREAPKVSGKSVDQLVREAEGLPAGVKKILRNIADEGSVNEFARVKGIPCSESAAESKLSREADIVAKRSVGEKAKKVGSGVKKEPITVDVNGRGHSGKDGRYLSKAETDAAKESGNVRVDKSGKTVAQKAVDGASEVVSGRNVPGTVTGGEKLKNVERMMRGTDGNIGVIPKEIADKMRGRQYSSFDAFREDFWKTVADSKYASEFLESDIERMRKGLAPEVSFEQRYGELKSYVLHHEKPIHAGGGVYDLDNITIVTPKMHQEILDKAYHFGH